MNSAHGVMCGRPDFHRLLSDIDIGQLFELMIHARQFSLYIVGRIRQLLLDPGNVQVNATVRTPPSLFDFANNAARDMIARQ